ncbi:MAG: hypothetical protein ACMXYF_01590 [Candidatus Woesearchaeota archaeon]
MVSSQTVLKKNFTTLTRDLSVFLHNDAEFRSLHPSADFDVKVKKGLTGLALDIRSKKPGIEHTVEEESIISSTLHKDTLKVQVTDKKHKHIEFEKLLKPPYHYAHVRNQLCAALHAGAHMYKQRQT